MTPYVSCRLTQAEWIPRGFLKIPPSDVLLSHGVLSADVGLMYTVRVGPSPGIRMRQFCSNVTSPADGASRAGGAGGAIEQASEQHWRVRACDVWLARDCDPCMVAPLPYVTHAFSTTSRSSMNRWASPLLMYRETGADSYNNSAMISNRARW